jgi:hypothetical protein
MHSGSELELRDSLAGQALAGTLVNPNMPEPGNSPFRKHAHSIAQQACGYADALLKARERHLGAEDSEGD